MTAMATTSTLRVKPVRQSGLPTGRIAFGGDCLWYGDMLSKQVGIYGAPGCVFILFICTRTAIPCEFEFISLRTVQQAFTNIQTLFFHHRYPCRREAFCTHGIPSQCSTWLLWQDDYYAGMLYLVLSKNQKGDLFALLESRSSQVMRATRCKEMQSDA
jgi:hypothetical protein